IVGADFLAVLQRLQRRGLAEPRRRPFHESGARAPGPGTDLRLPVELAHLAPQRVHRLLMLLLDALEVRRRPVIVQAVQRLLICLVRGPLPPQQGVQPLGPFLHYVHGPSPRAKGIAVPPGRGLLQSGGADGRAVWATSGRRRWEPACTRACATRSPASRNL